MKRWGTGHRPRKFKARGQKQAEAHLYGVTQPGRERPQRTTVSPPPLETSFRSLSGRLDREEGGLGAALH